MKAKEVLKALKRAKKNEQYMDKWLLVAVGEEDWYVVTSVETGGSPMSPFPYLVARELTRDDKI